MGTRWFLVVCLVMAIAVVRSQKPAAAGAAGTATMAKTITKQPQHPFCDQTPYSERPSMEIFSLDVKTGFLNGYRMNQTVIIEIAANFPDVWRIQQVFIHVPDYSAQPSPTLATAAIPAYQPQKVVGHWVWNMPKKASPDVGGTQAVDCGGTMNYGPFSMLSSIGAQAVMEIANPRGNGFKKVVAKWVPPSNWENIMYRRDITIEAYVTFETTPPGYNPPASTYDFQTGTYTQHQPPARWVKKEATLLNLDFIDLHNYMVRYKPMMNHFSKMMPAMRTALRTMGA